MMAGGPEYLVEIKDSQTGILIYRWSGYAANEYDALALAERNLESERA
jgi:hypothetical protein